MAKHYDVKGREYTPARPGDSLCRTCNNKHKDCTWPSRSIVICMQYDKEDPGQSELIPPPRDPADLYREAECRRSEKEMDSILEDSIR